MLEFIDSDYMESCLGSFSTASEGFVPERIGHNIPMSVIHSYMKSKGKRGGDGSDIEQSTYKLICTCLPDAEYVIGYICGDTETRLHEYQHAKYFFSREYREEVRRKWESLDEKVRNRYYTQLKEWGYSDEVVLDEFQAYWGRGTQVPR